MSGLAARLKSLREEELGLTVEQLAAKLRQLGVQRASASSVNRYERAEEGRMAPADYVAGVARVAGVDVRDVLFGVEGRGEDERRTAAHAAGFDRVAAVVLDVLEYAPSSGEGLDEGIAAELRRRGWIVRRDPEHPQAGTHPE